MINSYIKRGKQIIIIIKTAKKECVNLVTPKELKVDKN